MTMMLTIIVMTVLFVLAASTSAFMTVVIVVLVVAVSVVIGWYLCVYDQRSCPPGLGYLAHGDKDRGNAADLLWDAKSRASRRA